jgi:leucyl aminopeptidase
MQVTVESRSPAKRSADVLALPLAQMDPSHWRLPARMAGVDRAARGAVLSLLGTGDFRGKRGETLFLYPENGISARRILLVGLGEENRIDAEALREAAGIAVRATAQRQAKVLAIVGPGLRRLRVAAMAQAMAEGAILSGYRFDRYRSRSDDATGEVRSVAILFEKGADLRASRAAASVGVCVAESQNLARDLSNEPPNAMTPAGLARAAQKLAREVGLRARVLGAAEIRKRKLGAMLAVAGGSVHTPRLIVLEHNAPAKTRGARRPSRRPTTVCLVGKGVTFDSGGLSLKSPTHMTKMKHDMSGGATVIATLRAAALLKVPLHVVGIVGAVENMPGGTAYRPDDIVTAGSGRTIEVKNTDAEGRLVLADSLHFARSEFEPEALIDVATLTGACTVALGPWAAAVLGNNERLSDLIVKAGEKTGERFWPLPLWDVHREHLRSQVADVKQSGGREAGTITAAAFLSHFVGETPWAHLDIASTADTDRSGPLQRSGATGFGVRTLCEILRNWSRVKVD